MKPQAKSAVLWAAAIFTAQRSGTTLGPMEPEVASFHSGTGMTQVRLSSSTLRELSDPDLL